MREYLYGRHPVRESLRAGRRHLFRLWLAENLADAPIIRELRSLAARRGLAIENCPRVQLNRLAGTSHHQGVLLEALTYPYVPLETILASAANAKEAPLILILDLVQDVRNLGTLLRTAEAVGVHGVILQERRAAGITPAVVRASAGAVEHLLIAHVTNLVRTITSLQEEGLWVMGLEGEVAEAIPYTAADLTLPLGLVVGSEGKGLRRRVRQQCDWLLALPMRGHINSLNAAVAGSVALYEALRQRMHAHLAEGDHVKPPNS